MNSVQGSFTSQANIAPPAFCCSFSGKVMDEPVIAYCGHLFNQSVLKEGFHCPVDKTLITRKNIVPLNDLKKAICDWKTLITETQKASSSSIASTSSSSSEQVQLQPKSSAIDVLSTDLAEADLSKNWTYVERKIKHRPFKVIQAHQDDIHGLAKIAEKRFASGSKDCTLKMWTDQGDLVKELKLATGRGYACWVTALTCLSDGYWASGTRNGNVTIWDSKGDQSSSFWYNPSKASKESYVAKERNKERINCITNIPTTSPPYHIYTGTAKFIQRWDADTGRLVKFYEANENDWVYCIEILESQKLLVVIAANLEIWNLQNGKPDRTPLIQENETEKLARQRPHISAIARLAHNPNLVASALFDGRTKVADLETRRLIKENKEHEGRVWSVINLRPQTYASSADDRTIRVWDIRQAKSITTIDGNPGRVSSLLLLSENTFISGSCPDDPNQSIDKGTISFWDLRKF